MISNGRELSPREVDERFEPELKELKQRIERLSKELSTAKRRLKLVTMIVESWGEKANQADVA